MIQTIVEAAGTLGHQAKSNLARLWNSGLHYVSTQNLGKLHEKVNAVYEMLRPQVEMPEQVVASEISQEVSKEMVVTKTAENIERNAGILGGQPG